MKKPTLLELCKTTFYIGAIGYGGPAILAQMKKIIVHKKEWINEQDFMDALSLAQILPGATGVSLMGFMGYRLKKLWGAVLAPLFFALPAMIFMLVLTWAYFQFGNLSFIKSLFAGLGALVVALLVNATIKMGQSVFKKIDLSDIKGFFIAIAAFIGIYFLKFNVIWLILFSGLLGFLFYYFTGEFESEKINENNDAGSLRQVRESRKLSDFVPILILVLIIVVVFAMPLLTQIFGTFFYIGSFAFGGGFTTIPLIQHQVVDTLHWVTLDQFRDGIAMGQVTPGPVLITATFIGYKVYGIIGAVVATLAIFLPSLSAMVALSGVHAKIKNLKIVRVIIKGFLSGFIGLLVAVTLQFGFKSLVSWQTWLIFISSLIVLLYFKKDALWAILGAVVLSLIIL